MVKLLSLTAPHHLLMTTKAKIVMCLGSPASFLDNFNTNFIEPKLLEIHDKTIKRLRASYIHRMNSGIKKITKIDKTKKRIIKAYLPLMVVL